MIEYVSTLGLAPTVDFETAVLNGKAPDGGLYVPTSLPQISLEQLKNWKDYSYQQVCFEILSLFINSTTIPSTDLKTLIKDSFDPFFEPSVIVHTKLRSNQNFIVQELFHGPTLSFKDVAMGFVVNLFNYFLKRKKTKMTIMVATSGDTGPAAAHASIGKESLNTWLFYPVGLITDEQVRQMTTIMNDNVHAVGITNCKNGSDDLDDLINKCFSDQDFKETLNLSSVNSINWARVMMQTVHYFYGYLQNVTDVGQKINFSVPCGAFGNMCAGTMAKRMGLPVNKLLVANNANSILSEALQTGVFSKKNIAVTLSSAIDIAVPMNFWRYVYFCAQDLSIDVASLINEYDDVGKVVFPELLHKAISKDMLSYVVSDTSTLETIRSIHTQEDYLLDPHGAVAVAAARNCELDLNGLPTLCLATAHPAKFPAVTEEALGEIPPEGQHDSIEINKHKVQRLYTCDYQEMMEEIPKVMKFNHQK